MAENSMNQKKHLSTAAAFPGNEKYETAIKREKELYGHTGEKRSEFERDHTRILHSLGYRRLKHKTQVFFNTHNDHVCTRMEHVQHVESVSYTIAKELGLNTELTNAIAIGHDLGHAPFGHEGEKVLKDISEGFAKESFFHEKNSLIFVDDIELLQDIEGNFKNLNLTYAVRDGLISHCGEIDENGLRPREEAINLRKQFLKTGQYQPFTWEGCVVKLSDKIAYLGRDIEDAARMNFIDEEARKKLEAIAEEYKVPGLSQINTSGLINVLVSDLCRNSSTENGLTFSENVYSLLRKVKAYNYEVIYNNARFGHYKRYVKFVIETLYSELESWYKGADTFKEIEHRSLHYKELAEEFGSWLALYCDSEIVTDKFRKKDASILKNTKIYGKLERKEMYLQAAVDYIAGMTDQYAIKIFNSLTLF